MKTTESSVQEINADHAPAWLQAHLQQLPREMEPKRDLWPAVERGVAQTLSPKKRFNQTPYALAASLVIALASLTYGWQSYQKQLAAEQRMAEAQQLIEQIEAPYQYARVSYQEHWSSIRQGLAPETVEVIEKNLAAVQAAQLQIIKAIKKDPGNSSLQHLMYQTLNQEMSLYKKAEKINARSLLI